MLAEKRFSVKIASMGMVIPSGKINNEEIIKKIQASTPDADFLNEEWIVRRVGILERRRCLPEEDLVTTSGAALKQALERAGWDPMELDFIILASISTFLDPKGSAIPAMACKIQEQTGCFNAFAYDMFSACSGFVYGIGQAVAFIESGMARKGALLCCENHDKGLNYKDFKSSILIGDVSTATLLEKSETSAISNIELRANNESCLSDIIRLPLSKAGEQGYFSLDGRKVFKEGVNTMTELTRRALAHNGLTPETVDWFIYHQANKVMLQSVGKRVGIPAEKNLMNLEYMGNTTAGTIPSVLCENIDNGKIQRGHKVLCTAFGGGLTSGCLLLDF